MKGTWYTGPGVERDAWMWPVCGSGGWRRGPGPKNGDGCPRSGPYNGGPTGEGELAVSALQHAGRHTGYRDFAKQAHARSSRVLGHELLVEVLEQLDKVLRRVGRARARRGR